MSNKIDSFNLKMKRSNGVTITAHSRGGGIKG